MDVGKIEVKKLHENAQLPSRGSEYAAGYDLHAFLGDYCQCTIEPGQTFKVHTGVSMAIPDGYFGAIFARSGLATKKGLRPANCVGVIDSDYRGEIIVALHNDTDEPQSFKNGERIAQLVIMPYATAEFSEVRELNETKRGEGGFGSTGSNEVRTEKDKSECTHAKCERETAKPKDEPRRKEFECDHCKQLGDLYALLGLVPRTDTYPNLTWMKYLW